jgi:cytochrome bd-type quinol oxidase subunit 1
MNFLRRIHLYLGCFFAPMLVFFSVSGIWQVYGFQWVNGPNILTYLSTIHMGHQLFFKDPTKAYSLSSSYLEFFVVLMAASLVISILLGVIMAFKFGRGTLALASLAAGALIPLILIILFAHKITPS